MSEETMTLAEHNRATQKWVDTVCEYRNLAISLGAKPEQMLNAYDRDLAANHDPNDTEGWSDDTPELWEECDALEAKLTEARRLLALVYDDRTDWRTNAWFVAVENVGAWPAPPSPEQERNSE